ncbi:hypothetical protein OH492_18075 [Vibrio chagasii]|nr:hypothetical protein [Vibrio chagasii]
MRLLSDIANVTAATVVSLHSALDASMVNVLLGLVFQMLRVVMLWKWEMR